MPENLYPQLPTVPLISQESSNIEMVRNTTKTLRILKRKYAEKQPRYKMCTIDYYMHLRVQVLLL